MTLSAGTRLGPYEILAPLGAGGMGEVYRARDSRLQRDVAVKVLPSGLSSDPDRLRRFEQEARAAGVLNHPNILAIHDIGSHEGAPYIVSELLEGETLRERMGGSALPPRKALEIAIQITRGLAAAHDRGIVHRDLKPENLFITRDGHVKILDFGLAKLTLPEEAEPAGMTNLPTTPAGTDPGKILGTASYMSPEQVRGQPAGHRSDLFTFGAILYEILSGKRAFRRETAVETMNAILKEDPPDLTETNRNLPPALERIVRHCLEKRPEDRFQSARDLAFDLEAVSNVTAAGQAVAASGARAHRRRLKVALLGALIFAAIAAAFLTGRRTGAPPPSPLPGYQRLSFRRGTILSARFASDGNTVLYSAAWEGKPAEIFSTRPESPESRSMGFQDADLLGISSTGELALALKPRLEFGWMSRGTMARAPISGGAPREVAEDIQHADWSPDGRQIALIRWGPDRYRLEFPAGKVLVETAGWLSHVRVSPKGDRVAFAEHPQKGNDAGSISVVDRDGRRESLTDGWASLGGLAWSPDADEIWFAGARRGVDRALNAVDLSRKERVIAQLPGMLTLHDVFRDGRALLSLDNARREILVRRRGETEEGNLSWLEWSFPTAISDDGETILFNELGAGGGPGSGVYLRKTDGSPAVRLGDGFGVAISPDGRWALAIQGFAPPRLTLLPTGAGDPRPLDTGDLSPYFAGRWLPDGKRILYAAGEPGHGPRIYVQDTEGGKPRAISPEGIRAGYGNLVSNNGQWVAAFDPGQKAVLYPVEGGEPRPLPGAGVKDAMVHWSRDGRFIYSYVLGEIPARVDRLEVATGRREPWMEFLPPDSSGIIDIGPMLFTPDMKAYAYTYKSVLSNLYLVTGLKQGP